MFVYGETYLKLSYETATIFFLKSSGEVRSMLGTRCINTGNILYPGIVSALQGHDKRCNIKNGNIALIDLALGEVRSFNIERLLDITYHGELKSEEEIGTAYKEFKAIKTEYESRMPQKLSIDTLSE